MADRFRVEYNLHPYSDNGHRYRLKMDIWDNNGNFYNSVEIGQYSTFERGKEVQELLVGASYSAGYAIPWR